MEYHVPVLLNESIDGLKIKPNGVYVDVTFGGGGHSREILSRLTTGKLIGFDQDLDVKANLPEDERFLFVQQNFRYLKNFLKYHGYDKVDGILADLGVSSHHFDAAERGFSFRYDADLDMRMHQGAKFTAAQLLNTYSSKDLFRIFSKYGEVQNASKLANVIVTYREKEEINSIAQFKEVISDCLPKFGDNKYLAKVFQAIRIEVNSEVDTLMEFLLQTSDMIKEGGRLVVITYHSLEDRLVKNFIKKGRFTGEVDKDFYGNQVVPFEAVNKKVILPTDEEIEMNSRARSAKLRIAERV